ncbi:MAG: hypothetical protein ACFE94_11235 [Candidatus Hodarchaeota archaeon]
MLAIAAFLVADLIFGQESGGETVIGKEGHIFIHTIGGTAFLITGLLGFFSLKKKKL